MFCFGCDGIAAIFSKEKSADMKLLEKCPELEDAIPFFIQRNVSE